MRPEMVQILRKQHQGETAILLALNELEFHLCKHYEGILIQKEKEFNQALERIENAKKQNPCQYVTQVASSNPC